MREEDLYEDQRHTMGEVSEAFTSHRRVILRAACGWGKTTSATFAIARALVRGHRCYILVHRRELVAQWWVTLRRAGLDPGIIAAGYSPQYAKRLQICSVPSLIKRDVPVPSFVVVDETHHCIARTWSLFYDIWSRAMFLGLSATPIRMNGSGLGDYYEKMVCAIPEHELIKLKRLANYRAYSHPIDRDGLHSRAGDYIAAEGAKRVILGDLVESWEKHGRDLCTMGFAPTVEYSKNAAEAFKSAGHRFSHIDGTTPHEIRNQTILDLARGKLQGIWQVGLFEEGFDLEACAQMPVRVRCGIFARITKSLRVHLQSLGRPMRAGEGDAVLIDAAGNMRQPELGLPDDDRIWTLEGETSGKVRKAPSKTFCKKCFMRIPVNAIRCPDCGWIVERTLRQIPHEEGELVKIDRGIPSTCPEEEYGQLVLKGLEKEYKHPQAWARHEMERRRTRERPR